MNRQHKNNVSSVQSGLAEAYKHISCSSRRGGRIVSEVSSFLTAHQHKKGYLVPLKVYMIDENENNKEVKPMNVKSSLLS